MACARPLLALGGAQRKKNAEAASAGGTTAARGIHGVRIHSSVLGGSAFRCAQPPLSARPALDRRIGGGAGPGWSRLCDLGEVAHRQELEWHRDDQAAARTDPHRPV